MDEQVDDDQREQDPPEEAAPGDSPDTPETAEAPPPDAKRLITLAVPPIDQLLVLLGAAAMVISGLLSWIEVGPDAFPNFAGIGAGGGGVGLVVVLIGLALLSRRPQLDTANGVALGAFLASLVAVITLVDESGGIGMGAGAWVAMVGSVVALSGVSFGTMDPSRRPSRRVTHKAPATLGAALAVIASFWLDWSSGFAAGMTGSFPLGGGLDSAVATGYPVLILGVLVLLLLLGLLSPTASAAMQARMAMNVRVAGIAMVVLAAGDIAGSLMSSDLTGSGPILTLVGALMVTRSVGSAPAAEAAEADAA
ncbi:MAG: hypothetical protein J4F44_08115 [Acidimicrobiia bacterium]|nr:hypothetical protein [Acidimicrobiia bacterium]